MEYVTKHTVKIDNEVFPPNTPVEIKDRKIAQQLEQAGAIEEQRLTVSEARRAAAKSEKADDTGGAGKGAGAAGGKAGDAAKP